MGEISKILVLGAGLMGSGISQVAAQSGYQVQMRDISEELLNGGLESIKKNLQRGVDKGKMSAEDMSAVLSRITPTVTLDGAGEADLVIEAATENVNLKEKIFGEIDGLCPPETILASNTSSISITRLAAATQRPEKFIGMHFFNPVPVMPVVEIIRGLSTTDEVAETIKAVGQKMGKEVVMAKDYPAFLLNRILLPMLNEAFYCAMEGQGTPEEIDKGMKLAMGHPMGPLTLADFIGLDTLHSVLEVMYEGYGDPKYFPCPLLSKMVEAGHYGVKSGKGFYDYSKK